MTKSTRSKRIKTANKKQGFPSLTAGENWGKYLTGMAIETLYSLVISVLLLAVAAILLAVVK